MQSRPRLSAATLAMAGEAARPAYDRSRVTLGIVHLGVGAFHRAHQAVYVDRCIAAGETGWGIVGASLRSTDTRDALKPQDGLYTLAVQDGSGERLQVVGALLDTLVAPEDPRALVAVMADPAIRIVTLTVTEKAYLRDAAGGLDLAHADIRADLADPAAPRTVHGFIVAALEKRFSAGTAPFTVLCCDNLPANGETVRRLVMQFAQARDPALAERIGREVAFPSTMVDRIVPATTDADRARISAALGLEDAWPVKTEPFMQWVVEDRFAMGRPGWERFGVTMVGDVRPYEDMKLRLLNGAHSALAYLGLLGGLPTVADAFGDADLRGFVEGLWGEAVPTLPAEARLDTDAYTAALAERFANPALRHLTAQIANDGSQKLPQRIIATASQAIGAGLPAAHLALVPAAWIAACAARGGALPAGHFADPLDGALREIFGHAGNPQELASQVFAAAGFDRAAGEAAYRLSKLAAGYLTIMRDSGMRAAVAAARQGGIS